MRSPGHLGTDLTVLTVCDLKGIELPRGRGGGRQPHSELVLFLILQIKRNKNSSSNQTRQASWRGSWRLETPASATETRAGSELLYGLGCEN